MDLLKDNIKSLYFKYLTASFGSAIVTSIYSIVDMAMVGQYQGAQGSAALAIVAPVWNIIYSLGLLMGIGGAILFSTRKVDGKDANQFWTASVLGSIILALLAWFAMVKFEREILGFFGSDEELFPLAKEYLKAILWVFPLFLFNQTLIAFLRNDNDPKLATFAILLGGIFNVFGDYFFVFACDMGIYGAGLATALGSIISFVVLLSHFLKKKNSLKFVKVDAFFDKIRQISTIGFSSFFIDIAMGIITILFNRQIGKYLDLNSLAIYGTIIQISTFVQSCAYSVGQAAQPIISTNFAAKNINRVDQTLKLALYSSAFFGIFWTILSFMFPNTYIYIFMKPTDEILDVAPRIIRAYSISFLLLPFNIFSTYYFQSVLKPRFAFVVSILRGLVLSGAMILILPLISHNLIWFAMTITEILTSVYVVFRIADSRKTLRELSGV